MTVHSFPTLIDAPHKSGADALKSTSSKYILDDVNFPIVLKFLIQEVVSLFLSSYDLKNDQVASTLIFIEYGKQAIRFAAKIFKYDINNIMIVIVSKFPDKACSEASEALCITTTFSRLLVWSTAVTWDFLTWKLSKFFSMIT